MAAGSWLTAARRSKWNEYGDLSATGNRRRLGCYHPPTHAPPSPARARQPGMDLAGPDGSPTGEPDLVVAWPRGVLAHSAARCFALRGDNLDGLSPGAWFINRPLCHAFLCISRHGPQVGGQSLGRGVQPRIFRAQISWFIYITQEEPPMNTELVVTMFDGEDAASAAYQALRRLEQTGGIAILDAATLVKHSDGTSEIKDTQDVDTRHGAYFGVISGALIGLLGGPAGALIGSVAGAATGAASASLIDFGFPREDLQALDDQLANGSSALVVLVEATWLDKLDDALASFAGRSTSRSLHSDRADRIAAAAEAIEQELAELRLEDERGWAALLADFDADLARMDAQLAQESDLIRAELNAEAQAEAKLAELRDRRDAKRQELNQKIQARIDGLNAAITQRRAALADATAEAKAKADTRIATLETKRQAAQQQLEANWHAQQAEWQQDIDALKARAAKAEAAAKTRIDAQTAALEAKRQAAQQEWDQRKHATAAAAQDLKTGASEARADLRQAHEKAAAEFK